MSVQELTEIGFCILVVMWGVSQGVQDERSDNVEHCRYNPSCTFITFIECWQNWSSIGGQTKLPMTYHNDVD